MTASSTDVARPSENTAIVAPAFRFGPHDFGPHDSATSGAGSYQLDVYRNGLKRLFDLLAIIVTVPVTVPLIALLAVLVRLNGGHSFYSQARIGRGGRVYTMWKLRSMVMEADAALDAHLATDPAARTEWDRTQKLKSDPRTTRFSCELCCIAEQDFAATDVDEQRREIVERAEQGRGERIARGYALEIEFGRFAGGDC